MSSSLAPRQNTAAAPDADNRYKAVQAKLNRLGQAMDDATVELEGLRRRMRTNATRAESLATDIANAELDKTFVELTNNVATALGGAAVQVRNLHQAAQDVASSAHDAKAEHGRLYGALEDVRSSRRERTPRPGFLVH